jgi:hypothetical protein
MIQPQQKWLKEKHHPIFFGSTYFIPNIFLASPCSSVSAKGVETKIFSNGNLALA